MKTLEQHDADRLHDIKMREERMKPHPNGIECPKCQAELWDTDPTMSFMSNPPKKHVHCPKCGFVGYRIA